MKRIRSEGGHAWTLKGKCRFCGLNRADFKVKTALIATGSPPES